MVLLRLLLAATFLGAQSGFFTSAQAYTDSKIAQHGNLMFKKAVGSVKAPLTNAQRLARGMPVAWPGSMPDTGRHRFSRVRQARQVSGGIPLPPTTYQDPVYLLDTQAGTGSDDDYRGTVDLPFTVQFYQRNSAQVTVDINGVLSLPPLEDILTPYRNTALPSSRIEPYALAPYWDDLFINPSYNQAVGRCYIRYRLSTDNTRVTFEYRAVVLGTDTEQVPVAGFNITFSAITPGFVYFGYTDVNDEGSGGAHATIGVQGGDNRQYFQQYSVDTVSVTNGQVLVFDTNLAAPTPP